MSVSRILFGESHFYFLQGILIEKSIYNFTEGFSSIYGTSTIFNFLFGSESHIISCSRIPRDPNMPLTFCLRF